MDTLQIAHESALYSICYTVQSVVKEASTQALHRILRNRITQAKTKTYNKLHENAADMNINTNITEKDVEIAYDAARRVGERWMSKLLQAGEEDAVRILKIVLKNGRFFEDVNININDEIRMSQAADNDDNNNNNDETDQHQPCGSSYDGSSSVPSESESASYLNEQEQNDATVSSSIELAKDDENDKSVAFIALSKLGCQDPTNLNHNDELSNEACSTNQENGNGNGNGNLLSDTDTDIYSYWNHLPAAQNTGTTISECNNGLDNGLDINNNTNINHIPKCTNKPENKIQLLSRYQLYGHPSQSLHKTTASNMNLYNNNTQNPLLSLLIHNNNNDNDNHEFVKSQIKIIDELGYQRKTMWYYDWDIVQNAIERNRNRMHLQTLTGKKRKSDDEDEIREVLPKSALIGDTYTRTTDSNFDLLASTSRSTSNHQDGGVLCVQVQEDENDDSNIIVLPRTRLMNKRHKSIIQSKQQYLQKQQNVSKKSNSSSKNNNSDDIQVLRPTSRIASALGATKWSLEDINKDISDDDKQILLDEMLNINKQDSKEHEQESHFHRCVGSLKMVGSTHLWEQIKFGNWNGPVDELVYHHAKDDNNINDNRFEIERKKPHSKAKSKRLYPYLEFKKVGNL